MERQSKVLVEKHPDGYVAYPLGLKGVIVGEGETYEEALADVKSAIRFHIETFGAEGGPGRAAQHTDQRPVAALLPLAGRRRARRRDRRLSLSNGTA